MPCEKCDDSLPLSWVFYFRMKFLLGINQCDQTALFPKCDQWQDQSEPQERLGHCFLATAAGTRLAPDRSGGLGHPKPYPIVCHPTLSSLDPGLCAPRAFWGAQQCRRGRARLLVEVLKLRCKTSALCSCKQNRIL